MKKLSEENRKKKHRDSVRRYNHSDKGKACKKKYQSSTKGKTVTKRHRLRKEYANPELYADQILKELDNLSWDERYLT